MEDPNWNEELDQEADFSDRRLEQGAQVPSDIGAFCVALMRALSYSPPPQVEEAA